MYYYGNAISSTGWRFLFSLFAFKTFAALAYVARKCYEMQLRKRMVDREKVPLVDTLGWLRGSNVFTAPWKLMKGSFMLAPFRLGNLPGRAWYLLMVYIATMGYITHLMGATISSQSALKSCDFTEGLVLSGDTAVILETPTPSTASYQVAQQAQSYSADFNDCDSGVYDKINMTIPTGFCAQESRISSYKDNSDILGRWTCVSAGTANFSVGYQLNDVVSDSVEQGHIYAEHQTHQWMAKDSTGKVLNYTQLIIWSTSNGSTGSTWDVKFGVQKNYNSWHNTEGPQMHYSTCTYQASEHDNGITTTIMTSLNSSYIINQWVDILPQAVYWGRFSNSYYDNIDNIQLARVLNSVFMVAGGGDNLFSKTVSPTTFGCYGQITEIPNYVIAFLLLEFALFLLFSFWALILWLQLTVRDGFELTKTMPVDLWSWAAFAVSEADNKSFDITGLASRWVTLDVEAQRVAIGKEIRGD